MAKWADYGVSAVKFNREHTHIDQVKVHADNGDAIEGATAWSRQDVIKAIENGSTFVTIFKNSVDGKWKKGQPVYVIKVSNTKFIKTVDNGKLADNLDNLPEF